MSALRGWASRASGSKTVQSPVMQAPPDPDFTGMPTGDIPDSAAALSFLPPEAIEELKAAGSEPLSAPPAWATKVKVWELARSSVEPDWAEYDAPWLAVAYVYKKLGGKVVSGAG